MSAIHKCRMGRAQGFSLVEALVALVMLTAGALVMGAALSATNGAARDSLEASVAEYLARQKMTQLRLLPSDEIRDGSEVVDVDGVAYRRAWSARPRGGTGLSDLVVDVTWSEYSAPLSNVSPGQTVQGLSDPGRLPGPGSIGSASDLESTITDPLDGGGRTRTRSIAGFRAN